MLLHRGDCRQPAARHNAPHLVDGPHRSALERPRPAPCRAATSTRSSPAPASRVRESLLIETGLDLDRAWMVVDEHGDMRHPARAAAAGADPAHAAAQRHGAARARHAGAARARWTPWRPPTRVRVWDDVVKAYDMGALAAQWFSDFLGGGALRLVRFDPEQQRLSDAAWTGELAGRERLCRRLPAAGGLDRLARRPEPRGWPRAARRR